MSMQQQSIVAAACRAGVVSLAVVVVSLLVALVAEAQGHALVAERVLSATVFLPVVCAALLADRLVRFVSN